MIALSSGETAGIILEIDEMETTIICYSHQRLMFPSLRFSFGYKVCIDELKSLLCVKNITEKGLKNSDLLEVLREMGLKVTSLKNSTQQEFRVQSAVLGCDFSFEFSDYQKCLNTLVFGSTKFEESGGGLARSLCENIIESCRAAHPEEWTSMVRNLLIAGPGSSLPGTLHII